MTATVGELMDHLEKLIGEGRVIREDDISTYDYHNKLVIRGRRTCGECAQEKQIKEEVEL